MAINATSWLLATIISSWYVSFASPPRKNNSLQLADLVHKEFPQVTTTLMGTPGINPPVKYRMSNEKSRTELGITYLPLETTFRDAVRELLELNEKGKLQ